MIYLEMDKSSWEIINSRLPDIFPNVNFSLLVIDDNIKALGFWSSELCVVAFDIDETRFERMLLDLTDLETDAFNTADGKPPNKDDPDYQRYLKYGILWDILFNAKQINLSAE